MAARKARAIRDEKQTDKAVALVTEYETIHGTLTSTYGIQKRRAKDAADLANGISQEVIDKRNRGIMSQQAAHVTGR